MPFWSADHTANPNLKDPKRAFRFKVSFQGINDGGPAGGGPILGMLSPLRDQVSKLVKLVTST